MKQPARWRSNGFRRREGGFDKLADPRGADVTITPYPGTALAGQRQQPAATIFRVRPALDQSIRHQLRRRDTHRLMRHIAPLRQDRHVHRPLALKQAEHVGLRGFFGSRPVANHPHKCTDGTSQLLGQGCGIGGWRVFHFSCGHGLSAVFPVPVP
jgi:hypothetical protein